MKYLKRFAALLITASMILSTVVVSVMAATNDVGGIESYQTLVGNVQKMLGGTKGTLSFVTNDSEIYLSPESYLYAIKVKFDMGDEKFGDFIEESVLRIQIKPDSANELNLYMMEESASDDSITPYNQKEAVLGTRVSGDATVTLGREYYYEFTVNSVSEQLKAADTVAFNIFNSADGARLGTDRILLINSYMSADEALATITEDSTSEYIAKVIRFLVGESAYNAYNIMTQDAKAEIDAIAKNTANGYDAWKQAMEAELVTEVMGDANVIIASSDVQKLSTNYHAVTGYAGTDSWNATYNAHKVKLSTAQIANKDFIKGVSLSFKSKADGATEAELYVTNTSYEDVIENESALDVSASVDALRVTAGDYTNQTTYEYNADLTEFANVIKENDNAAFLVYGITTSGTRVDFSSFKLTAEYATAEDAVAMYKAGELTIDELLSYTLTSAQYSDYTYLTEAQKAAVAEVANGDFVGIDDWKENVVAAIADNTTSTVVRDGVEVTSTNYTGYNANYNGTPKVNAVANSEYLGHYFAQKVVFDVSTINCKKFIETATITVEMRTDGDVKQDIYLMPTVVSNDDVSKESSLDASVAAHATLTDPNASGTDWYKFEADATSIVKSGIVDADNLAYMIYNTGVSGARVNQNGKTGVSTLAVNYVSGEKAVAMYKNAEVTAQEVIDFVIGSQTAATFVSMSDAMQAEVEEVMSQDLVTLDDWVDSVKAKIAELYGSADASFTSGLVNTNQDVIYSGVKEKSLTSVTVNDADASGKYTYNADTQRLTIDKSLFAAEGNYTVTAVFVDSESNEYTLNCVITVKKQYIYNNNFDEYDAAALANDPFGKAGDKTVVGASTIAPEWSVLPHTYRYNGEEFRYWYAQNAGKIQNRIVDYTVDGKTSKGITLENISIEPTESYTNLNEKWNNWGKDIAMALDLDRVYGDAINNETLGSDKLNFSFDVTFDYEPEMFDSHVFKFGFDNSINHGIVTHLMSIDPNWGVVISQMNENRETILYQSYDKITGNNLNYGAGNHNNGISWYLLHGKTTNLEFSLDMADMSALKLYVKVNGINLEFEQYNDTTKTYVTDENGNIIRTDYIPLPNVRKLSGNVTVDNYFSPTEPGWMGQMFPYGYDGLTMLKFAPANPDTPIVIDNVVVQSEIQRIKSEIAAISDIEDADAQKLAAKEIYADYLALSAQDKLLINNIALLTDYDLFAIDSAQILENSVIANISALTADEYKVVATIYETNERFTTLVDKVVLNSSDIVDGTAKLDFTEIPEGATVKVMLWNKNLSRPLCDAVSVQ